ncbi:NADPH oxidase regulator NoxR [Rhizoctonia solani AG-3 Rhs1AP]|uniref:NADPH oxidase regulator NoxR n=2 Tax=Rhizoctonia solani AG-3 TaxID=1086053 RepID=A0A074S8U0_9AGAM|nr:NADPH oxidase regulator NoxR [Rhizoctonia solani AG-3 Rhs1AP]KEP55644.1 NADPH oxidase regulator NoxR [Rhizoctonia solani 123E]
MSLKLELETWAKAIKAYDEENFEESLQIFASIAESSKILTNMGLIYATIGEHETAVQHFRDAVGLDRYLAVAYFQCGVSNFLLGHYEEAYQDFNEALIFLRGNQAINYEQLGLKFRLYSAEVLFNRGLCLIYMGRLDNGLQDMREAQLAKVTEEHGVIDDAIQDQGEGYTVFSIPVGVLYRPSESKLKNAKTKDYLGKAQLIAASDANDAFTTFTGVTRLQQGLTPSGAPITDGRPLPARSRAVTSAARVETSLTPQAPEVQRPTTPMLQKSVTVGPGIFVQKPDAEPALDATGPGLFRNASSAAGLSRGPTISRNTSASASASGASASGSGGQFPPPVRGLSVRRPGTAGSTQSRPDTAGSMQSQGPPRLPSVRTGGESLITPERSPVGDLSRDREPPRSAGRSQRGGTRMTEFYEDYIGAYEDPAPPMPDKVATWAAQTKGAPPPPRSRAPSVVQRGGYDRGSDRGYDERSRAAPSSYGGSSMGVRRKMSRRPTIGYERPPMGYEEDEEGYASGDYSDLPFELTKIRVKLHYKDEARGMAISPEMRFEEFLDKVSSKFGRQLGTLGLKFKDEDGGRVSMRDDSDYDLAIETARESAKGRPEGKLEIWCVDE